MSLCTKCQGLCSCAPVSLMRCVWVAVLFGLVTMTHGDHHFNQVQYNDVISMMRQMSRPFMEKTDQAEMMTDNFRERMGDTLEKIKDCVNQSVPKLQAATQTTSERAEAARQGWTRVLAGLLGLAGALDQSGDACVTNTFRLKQVPASVPSNNGLNTQRLQGRPVLPEEEQVELSVSASNVAAMLTRTDPEVITTVRTAIENTHGADATASLGDVLRAVEQMGSEVEARKQEKMAAMSRHLLRGTRALVEGFTVHEGIADAASFLSSLVGSLDPSKMAALEDALDYLEKSVSMIQCRQ